MKKRQQGAHYYNGKRNSRGQRTMSKLFKGLNPGDTDRAFKEIEELNRQKQENKYLQ